MAIHPVSLCADLQPWHDAGLAFIYLADTDVSGLLRGLAVRPAATRPPHPKTPAKTESSAKSAVQTAAQNAALRRNEVSETPGIKATPVADMAAEAPGPLPPAWQALAAKLKPAPVVWSYIELGEDLLIKGNPERGKALRELIGNLGLKGGTSAFLPVVLPGSPDDGSEAWCFEAVLNRLDSRILAVFGPEALAPGPYAQLGLEPFQQKIVRGRLVLCLPSFAEILSNPDRFEATTVFLRSAFAKINIL